LQHDDAEVQGKTLSKFARKVLSAQKQPPAPTLFFGNLGFETTVDSIRGLLEAHRTKKEKEKSSAGTGASESANDAEAPSKDPWIRKIRMGTFEDSGLCKGFAFVDFTSTEHATAALIHPKNHQLDGRKLVVEYASADAVRRGGGAGPRPKKTSAEGTGEGGHTRRKKPESAAAGDCANDKSHTATVMTTKNSTPPEERGIAPGRRSDASAKAKVTRKPRPAPGAALALARREQVAIVPSQGRRITFDD